MRSLVLIAALLLAGCQREPDFDERYDGAAKEIRERAKAIDAELASEGAAAEDAAVAR